MHQLDLRRGGGEKRGDMLIAIELRKKKQRILIKREEDS